MTSGSIWVWLMALMSGPALCERGAVSWSSRLLNIARVETGKQFGLTTTPASNHQTSLCNCLRHFWVRRVCEEHADAVCVWVISQHDIFPFVLKTKNVHTTFVLLHMQFTQSNNGEVGSKLWRYRFPNTLHVHSDTRDSENHPSGRCL